MEGLLNRVLPHNLEAERGIIRSILIDSEKISKVTLNTMAFTMTIF